MTLQEQQFSKKVSIMLNSKYSNLIKINGRALSLTIGHLQETFLL